MIIRIPSSIEKLLPKGVRMAPRPQSKEAMKLNVVPILNNWLPNAWDFLILVLNSLKHLPSDKKSTRNSRRRKSLSMPLTSWSCNQSSERRIPKLAILRANSKIKMRSSRNWKEKWQWITSPMIKHMLWLTKSGEGMTLIIVELWTSWSLLIS